MKKIISIVGIVILILVIVSLRLYRKYDRQKIGIEKNKKQQEWVIKTQKKRDSLNKVKQDSLVQNSYKRKRDSMNKELYLKQKKLQETLKKLNEQK